MSTVELSHPSSTMLDMSTPPSAPTRAGARRYSSWYIVHAEPRFALRFMRAEDKTWIVEDAASGVFGAGAGPLEAYHDFRRAVVEHVDVLERDEHLASGLVEQLEYLRQRL